MKLARKTALVTGGSSGIGFETAKLFAQEGAQVIITGRNQSKLDEAVSKLGANVSPLQADITSMTEMQEVGSVVEKKFGKLDILFANAGIGGWTPLSSSSPETFECIVKTNLTGVFFTVSALSAHLREGASVILNGSVHAELGEAGFAGYAASKAGVRAMGRVFASELSPRRIRVNVVTPGGTHTPIWDSIAPGAEAFAKLEKKISRGIPLRRFGRPDEVAKTVLFLASDDASNIQAAEIIVDGGATGAPRGAPVYFE